VLLATLCDPENGLNDSAAVEALPPPLHPSADAPRPNNRRRAGVRAADGAAAGEAGEEAGLVVRVPHTSWCSFQLAVGQVGEGLAVERELQSLLLHQRLL